LTYSSSFDSSRRRPQAKAVSDDEDEDEGFCGRDFVRGIKIHQCVRFPNALGSMGSLSAEGGVGSNDAATFLRRFSRWFTPHDTHPPYQIMRRD
jgi:hypothetical protein